MTEEEALSWAFHPLMIGIYILIAFGLLFFMISNTISNTDSRLNQQCLEYCIGKGYRECIPDLERDYISIYCSNETVDHVFRVKKETDFYDSFEYINEETVK